MSMIKVKLLFGEVEHEGDLDFCRDAVSRAGGSVESSGFNEDAEDGWVIAQVTDRDSARALVLALRNDNRVCFDGSRLLEG